MGALRSSACLSCLTAVRKFNPKFTVGRGSSKFNEPFAWVLICTRYLLRS
jgi:hypothetical protein